MDKMRLPKLLDCFSVQELADALFQASLTVSGTKAEKIERLCAQVQAPPHQPLDLFTAEALRIVCGLVGVRLGRKSEMIEGLISLLEEGSSSGAGASAAMPTQAEQVRPAYV